MTWGVPNYRWNVVMVKVNGYCRLTARSILDRAVVFIHRTTEERLGASFLFSSLFLHMGVKMKFHSSIRFSYLRIVFLVGIYVLFFLAELHYNFDANLVVAFATNTHSYHSVRKYNKPPGQVNTSFRFNKRFQPSFIPAEFCVSKEIPIEHGDRLYPAICSSESLLNIFLLTKSLRAPPRV